MGLAAFCSPEYFQNAEEGQISGSDKVIMNEHVQQESGMKIQR